MNRALHILLLCGMLSSCSSWVDSTRSSIYGWCGNHPEYCDIQAVKP